MTPHERLDFSPKQESNMPNLDFETTKTDVFLLRKIDDAKEYSNLELPTLICSNNEAERQNETGKASDKQSDSATPKDKLEIKGEIKLPTGDLLTPGEYASELKMPNGEKLIVHVGGSWLVQGANGDLIAARHFQSYPENFSPAAETLDNGAKLGHVGPFRTYSTEEFLDKLSAHWIMHYPSGDTIYIRDLDGQVNIERTGDGIGTAGDISFHPGSDPKFIPARVQF